MYKQRVESFGGRETHCKRMNEVRLVNKQERELYIQLRIKMSRALTKCPKLVYGRSKDVKSMCKCSKLPSLNNKLGPFLNT